MVDNLHILSYICHHTLISDKYATPLHERGPQNAAFSRHMSHIIISEGEKVTEGKLLIVSNLLILEDLRSTRRSSTSDHGSTLLSLWEFFYLWPPTEYYSPHKSSTSPPSISHSSYIWQVHISCKSTPAILYLWKYLKLMSQSRINRHYTVYSTLFDRKTSYCVD